MHCTRTKLLHLRNTTYGWPNSCRKLYSGHWLIWTKITLQLHQRIPHWHLQSHHLEGLWYIIYPPTLADLVLLPSFSANLNILKQLKACESKVFCKYCSNIVTLLEVFALLHIQKTYKCKPLYCTWLRKINLFYYLQHIVPYRKPTQCFVTCTSNTVP